MMRANSACLPLGNAAGLGFDFFFFFSGGGRGLPNMKPNFFGAGKFPGGSGGAKKGLTSDGGVYNVIT